MKGTLLILRFGVFFFFADGPQQSFRHQGDEDAINLSSVLVYRVILPAMSADMRYDTIQSYNTIGHIIPNRRESCLLFVTGIGFVRYDGNGLLGPRGEGKGVVSSSVVVTVAMVV